MNIQLDRRNNPEQIEAIHDCLIKFAEFLELLNDDVKKIWFNPLVRNPEFTIFYKYGNSETIYFDEAKRFILTMEETS